MKWYYWTIIIVVVLVIIYYVLKTSNTINKSISNIPQNNFGQYFLNQNNNTGIVNNSSISNINTSFNKFKTGDSVRVICPNVIYSWNLPSQADSITRDSDTAIVGKKFGPLYYEAGNYYFFADGKTSYGLETQAIINKKHEQCLQKI